MLANKRHVESLEDNEWNRLRIKNYSEAIVTWQKRLIEQEEEIEWIKRSSDANCLNTPFSFPSDEESDEWTRL